MGRKKPIKIPFSSWLQKAISGSTRPGHDDHLQRWLTWAMGRPSKPVDSGCESQ